MQHPLPANYVRVTSWEPETETLAQRLSHTQLDIQLITPRGTFFLPANAREKRFLEGRMFLLFERMQNLVIFCESSTCETICGHI